MNQSQRNGEQKLRFSSWWKSDEKSWQRHWQSRGYV